MPKIFGLCFETGFYRTNKRPQTTDYKTTDGGLRTTRPPELGPEMQAIGHKRAQRGEAAAKEGGGWRIEDGTNRFRACLCACTRNPRKFARIERIPVQRTQGTHAQIPWPRSLGPRNTPITRTKTGERRNFRNSTPRGQVGEADARKEHSSRRAHKPKLAAGQQSQCDCVLQPSNGVHLARDFFALLVFPGFSSVGLAASFLSSLFM